MESTSSLIGTFDATSIVNSSLRVFPSLIVLPIHCFASPVKAKNWDITTCSVGNWLAEHRGGSVRHFITENPVAIAARNSLEHGQHDPELPVDFRAKHSVCNLHVYLSFGVFINTSRDDVVIGFI